jgi:hypothetical protein
MPAVTPAVALLTPEVSALMKQLQCLDDAIGYRLHRLSLPCADCLHGSGGLCPPHDSDFGLIESYQRRYGTALGNILAGSDPADIRQITDGDRDTPVTVLAMSLAIQARLRELAAGGPVLTEFGDGPVLIDLEDGVLIEHPLEPAAPGSDHTTEAGR